MTDKTAKTLTSSGYYVSQEAPIQTDNPALPITLAGVGLVGVIGASRRWSS